jgi:phosphate transport system substrate-binding protein
MPTRRTVLAAALALAALPLVASCGGRAPAGSASASGTGSVAGVHGQKVQLAETGSSLLYPLFNLWQPDFQALHPDIQLTTASTGSGAGIAQAIQGLVQIGASDAYMSDEQARQHPDMLNIPLVISAQQIQYNLPGLGGRHLQLDGAVLAGIYTGKIQYWDDPALRSLNPGVPLPHQAIVPVRRSDGSGDTFLFTTYLTDAASSAWTAGLGTTVNWPPVPAEIAANGNQGVEQALKQTPGSIGYLGISWLDTAVKDGLGYAALRNKDGQFVLPTQETIAAAARAVAGQTPKDERISLVYAPGADAYPIVNYEYAIVSRKQPNAATAQALKTFLQWALDRAGGSAASYLNRVHFIALPPEVVALSKAQIDTITG